MKLLLFLPPIEFTQQREREREREARSFSLPSPIVPSLHVQQDVPPTLQFLPSLQKEECNRLRKNPPNFLFSPIFFLGVFLVHFIISQSHLANHRKDFITRWTQGLAQLLSLFLSLFGRKTLFLNVADYRLTAYYTVGLISPFISLSLPLSLQFGKTFIHSSISLDLTVEFWIWLESDWKKDVLSIG